MRNTYNAFEDESAASLTVKVPHVPGGAGLSYQTLVLRQQAVTLTPSDWLLWSLDCRQIIKVIEMMTFIMKEVMDVRIQNSGQGLLGRSYLGSKLGNQRPVGIAFELVA